MISAEREMYSDISDIALSELHILSSNTSLYLISNVHVCQLIACVVDL